MNKSVSKNLNVLKVFIIIVSIIFFPGIILGIVAFPCVGEKGLLHYLCMGIFYIGVSFVGGFLVWDRLNSNKRTNKADVEKKTIKSHMITVFFVIFTLANIVGGLNYTIESLLDLSSQKTNEIILENTSVEVHHRKNDSPSFKLTGRDKENNEYEFGITKKEYDEFDTLKNSNSNLKITYYEHTKTIKNLNLIK